MIKSKFYQKTEADKIKCLLCPHGCSLSEGSEGVCRVRRNLKGELYSLNYGLVTSMALDPIEKKPLYRFFPGSKIFSLGTVGCNFKCSFCQNWTIAHTEADTVEVTPEEAVAKADELKAMGNIGIAYTYNEPSIWYEFVLEASRLAREEGLKNVLVTNGFINKEPLRELLPYIDAMNIDVKSFNDKFYAEICNGALDVVKNTVEAAAGKCHVEVTTLIIPGLNDNIEEMDRLSRWLSGISPEIPLHLSRYFPNYRMQDRPPTPAQTLYSLRDTALKHLKYVFLGNI